MTTVQNMWDLAKDLADTPGGFGVDARGIQYANTALRVLHTALANAHNGDYFRSTSSISVLADTESYNLPADFMRAIKVFYEPASGDRRYPVDKFDIDGLRGWRKYPFRAGTCQLWYVPTPTVFTLITSTFETIYPSSGVDFIAYHMAIQLANRQEDLALGDRLSRERANIMQSIMDAIEPRDEEAEEVVDVYGRWDSNSRFSAAAEDRGYRYRIMGTQIHFTEGGWRGV